MTTTIITIVLMAFLASFIQRVSGFGFGIAFMTIVPFVMPSFGESTALSGMLAIICALFTSIRLYKHVRWDHLIIILLTFIVVSFFSVKLLTFIDNVLLKKILGVVLVLVSVYFLYMDGKIHLKPTALTQVSMGTVSGVMGGLFGMQGPPAVIYFLSCADNKAEYMAITQWYFIIGNLAMTFFRAGHGFVTPHVWELFAVGVPSVLLGLFVGGKVFDKISVRLLRKIVYIFIGVAGLIALFPHILPLD